MLAITRCESLGGQWLDTRRRDTDGVPRTEHGTQRRHERKRLIEQDMVLRLRDLNEGDPSNGCRRVSEHLRHVVPRRIIKDGRQRTIDDGDSARGASQQRAEVARAVRSRATREHPRIELPGHPAVDLTQRVPCDVRDEPSVRAVLRRYEVKVSNPFLKIWIDLRCAEHRPGDCLDRLWIGALDRCIDDDRTIELGPMQCSGRDRDEPAHRVPDDDGPSTPATSRSNRENFLRPRRDVVGVASAGVAMPRHVEGDDTEAVGEEGGQRRPPLRVRCASMNEDERRSAGCPPRLRRDASASDLNGEIVDRRGERPNEPVRRRDAPIPCPIPRHGLSLPRYCEWPVA